MSSLISDPISAKEPAMTAPRRAGASEDRPLVISGVLPRLAVKADHFPARTETGIGALMPWANRLWFVTYVAHKAPSGGGTGLYWVDDDLRLHKHPQSRVGTFANRMVHKQTEQLIIGPHVIDAHGHVRTIEGLLDIRVAATMEHLTDPEHKIYCLGMEGEFVEVDLNSLEVTALFDLCTELGIDPKRFKHFKDGYTAHGRVAVCNNTYEAADHARGARQGDGRLAEWTPGDTSNGANAQGWRVIERCQFNGLAHRTSIGQALFAIGADPASAILKTYLPSTGWVTYRLPKGTHTQDNTVTTEWPRIREVESERWLLNASGMFYELPAMQYEDRVWGVQPICRHLRIIGDYCAWNGMLVLAGDQTTPVWDKNIMVGQPQANLWFGKTDDLWNFGKPKGWGGPWWKTSVNAGKPSDPYLMTGFEHKCLHVTANSGGVANVHIELDFTGCGDFHRYATLRLDGAGYAHHAFPSGLSAHWVRLVSDSDLVATAQLHYT